MSVSTALENSARNFCVKYACNFDFVTLESRVEEFTFLRPNSGWTDAYKMVFEGMYMQALETSARENGITLDSEAMLDDFEYTLIRPYMNEGNREFKHKPYVGMDRVSRLEYLQQIASRSPSNSVDLYAKKYKNGELSIKQMRSKLELGGANPEYYIELAGFIQALETVNRSRSLVWRVFHPFKNNAEKRNSEQMKRAFIQRTKGGEVFYTEASAAAYETFDGHQRVRAGLEESMIHAREELSIKQKLNDVMRESIRIEGFEKESLCELSPKIDARNRLASEKQI